MARYALVVGITDYKSPLKNLSKPATDAEAVAQVLQAHGDFEDIKLLKGNVTKQQLGDAFKILLRRQAVNNEAIIYFTGHGITISDLELETQQAYLATSDLKIETQGNTIVEQTSGISLINLNQLIAESHLSSLVVLLDCCHSGHFLERHLIEKTLTAFSSQRDYYFIAACRGFQQAYAKKSEQHSIFTTALLNGLSAENANVQGLVTGDRLFDRIASELKGSGQEPIRMGWGRSITLVKYSVQQTTAVIDETCPYQGLRPFGKEQARFFFGRDQVIQQLNKKLSQANFVPIIGASGSGKSSVVRAGLIPVLEKNGWRVLEPILPGVEPLAELKRAFTQLFGRTEIREIAALIDTAGLSSVISRLTGSERCLLVVDQFEEIFTLGAREEERQRCIELLTQVSQGRLAIVTTMRADFLEYCLSYESLTQIIQEQAVYMPPLLGAELEEAIVSPAMLQGYQLERGLLGAIQQEVLGQEKGCLPLLQFALTELWEQRDQENHQLTVAKFKELGGVIGALNRHAEKLYAGFSEQQQTWVKRIFLKLVRTGAEDKDTRQRQPKRELLSLASDNLDEQPVINQVIEKLIQGRLIVTDTEIREEVWIDLAHEALIDGWQRLQEWRQQDRNLRHLHDKLADALREWLHQGEDEQYLMPRGLLAEVRENWENLQPDLSSQAKKFYHLSDADEKERSAKQQIGLRVINKEQLRDKAEEVKSLLPYKPLDALILAIQVVGENLQKIPEQILTPVQQMLSQVVIRGKVSISVLGHQGAVSSVAISSDSQTIVSGGDDATVRLWNTYGQSIAQPLYGHEGDVSCVAISNDGKLIVSGGGDGTVRLWNINGSPSCETFYGHEGYVSSVCISNDGKLIVSSGGDGKVRLWDIQGYLIAEFLYGHHVSISSIAISSDGRTIVSSGSDGTVKLWNIDGHLIAEVLHWHEGNTSSVAISSDGETIVSSGSDGTVKLWNIKGEPLIEPLRGHEGYVWSVAISHDGQTIASVGEDSTVRLWSIRTVGLWNIQGQALNEPLYGHEDCVWSVAISDDGQTVVSGGEDGTVRLWNIQNQLLAKSLCGHKNWVNCVAISDDGQTIVSGSEDGTIRLWNIQGQSLVEPLRGHEDWVYCVAISSDGQTIVSGGNDETVRLWNIQGHILTEPLRGHRGEVLSVVISSKRKTVVSGGEDGTIRLWNIQGQPLTEPFRSHERRINSVAISYDEKTIVSGGDEGTVNLWSIQGDLLTKPFCGHESRVNSVAISHDGKIIVSGGEDGTVRLWNIQGQPLTEPIRSHENRVNSVAISRDGKTIVSSSDDGTVRLSDTQGQPLAEPIRSHENRVNSVAISHDGKIIVSGGDDGTVKLWRGNWQAWLQSCCDMLRYHPISTDPPTEEAKAACEVCRKYVWSNVE